MSSEGARPLRMADRLAALRPGDEGYAIALTHGSLEAGVYAPRGTDAQTPHTRDEVYVVVHGRGLFRRGERRDPFGPGDLLFVPAGESHRFEDFSDDLAVWVIFCGPEGGERAAAGAQRP